MANVKSKYKFIQKNFNNNVKNIDFLRLIIKYFKEYYDEYLSNHILKYGIDDDPYDSYMEYYGFYDNNLNYTDYKKRGSYHSDFRIDDFQYNDQNYSQYEIHKLFINFVPYVFNKLKDLFYEKFDIDKESYDIEFYNVFNYMPFEQSSFHRYKYLDYFIQYPYIRFNYPCLNQVNVEFEDNKENYIKDIYIRQHAIYFYKENVFVYSQLKNLSSKAETLYSSKDVTIKIDPNNVNSDDLKYDVVEGFVHGVKDKTIQSVDIKILPNLSILVRDKSNNKIAFLTNINKHSKRIKIIKECNGFNDIIEMKIKVNQTTPYNMSDEKYDMFNALKSRYNQTYQYMDNKINDYVNNYIVPDIEKYICSMVTDSISASRSDPFTNVNFKLSLGQWFDSVRNTFYSKYILDGAINIKTFKTFNSIFYINLKFPKYHLITELDNRLFEEKNIYYLRNGTTISIVINKSNIKILTNYKWLHLNIKENNKRFRSQNAKKLEEIEAEKLSLYIDASLPKYDFLFQDIPQVEKFVKYYYNNINNIKNNINRIYKSVFDSKWSEDLDVKLKEYFEISKGIKKIQNEYRFGAQIKKTMKSINEFEDIDDVVTQANYYIGNSLNMQYTSLDNVCTPLQIIEK